MLPIEEHGWRDDSESREDYGAGDDRNANGIHFEEAPDEALADRVLPRMPIHNRWENERE